MGNDLAQRPARRPLDRQSYKPVKTVRTTVMVTGIIILSKLLGFVREMVMAAYFGRGIESDAYVTAYGILSIMTLLFSAGIASTFIPIYTRTLMRQGRRGADMYASNILTIYCIAGILGSILAYFGAPWICSLIYRTPSAEGLQLTIDLTRLMYPSLAFWAMTGVLCNVLNAREQFIPEQLMGFVLSACLIFACVTFQDIRSVAIAVSVVGVLQFLLLLPFLRGHFRYVPGLRLSDRRMRRTFFLAIPALISMAFDEINHQIDRVIGTGLGTGVVTALSKSYTLVTTALGILVVPITTIMFSRLSKIAANRNRKLFVKTVRQSIETIALITLPVIVICVLMRNDLIALAYQRGAFTADDTAFTAPVFACYILGLFTFGLRSFLTRVFYALQDTRTPMVVGICSVVLNIGLNLLFSRFWGAMGLTLATSLSSVVGSMVLLSLMHRKLGRIGLSSMMNQFFRIFIALALCALVVLGLMHWMPAATGSLALLGRLGVTALASLLVYFIACAFLRVRAVHDLLRMVLFRNRR